MATPNGREVACNAVSTSCIGPGRIFPSYSARPAREKQKQTHSVTCKPENGRLFAVNNSGRSSSQGGTMTTDPVCGMEVNDKNAEFQTQFAGKKYFFCSEECRKEFEQQPNEYVETAA
jgi:YHS domain-containing protein